MDMQTITTTTTMVDGSNTAGSTSTALSASSVDKNSNVSSESSIDIENNNIHVHDENRTLEGSHEYNKNSSTNLLSSSFISIASNLSMRSGTSTAHGSNSSLFGSKTNLHHGLQSTSTALDFLFLEEQEQDQQQLQQQHHIHPETVNNDHNQQNNDDNEKQSLKNQSDGSLMLQGEQQGRGILCDNGLKPSSTQAVTINSNSKPSTLGSACATPTRSALSTSGSSGGIMLTPTIGIRKSSNQLTTRKSVDFAILPPSPKRMRQMVSPGASNIHSTSTSDLLQIGPPSSPCYYHIDQIVSSPSKSMSEAHNPVGSNNMRAESTNTASIVPDDSSNNSNIILVTPPSTNDCCWTSRQVVDGMFLSGGMLDKFDTLYGMFSSLCLFSLYILKFCF
jgi:hypothetical protein